MPAYNVGEFIAEAIESVRQQTYPDWRLIVINDGSTDGTLEIAREYESRDERIKVISSPLPSGSPLLPRFLGIEQADTDFIIPMDSDDWIERDYLEQIVRLQERCDLDAVYPTMVVMKHGEERDLIPGGTDLYGEILNGREAFRLTLNGWKINLNGGLLRRNIWLKVYLETAGIRPPVKKGGIFDEVQERLVALESPRVGISHSRYYYRDNENSMARLRTSRLFHYLVNNRLLIDYIRQRFGEDSEEYRSIQLQNFYGVVWGYRLLSYYKFQEVERGKAMEMIEDARRITDRGIIKSETSFHYRFMAALPSVIACGVFGLIDRLRKRYPDV